MRRIKRATAPKPKPRAQVELRAAVDRNPLRQQSFAPALHNVCGAGVVYLSLLPKIIRVRWCVRFSNLFIYSSYSGLSSL